MTSTSPAPEAPQLADGQGPSRRWAGLLRLLGPALLIWVLTKVDLSEVFGALRLIPPWRIAVAMLFCVLIVLNKGLRWWAMLRGLGYREPLPDSLLVIGDATFWGTLTPGRLGEFRKIVHLGRRHGLSMLRGAWLNVIDRAFDVVALLILFCVGVTRLPPDLRAGFRPAVFVALLAAVGVAGLARRVWAGPLEAWAAAGTGRLRGGIVGCVRDFRALSAGRLALLIGVSVLGLLLYTAQVGVLAGALPYDLTASQLAVCVVTTMLAGVLPVSYFNLGSRDIVLIGLFHVFGLSRPREAALQLSLMFILCYVLLMTVTGVFWWLARSRIYGRPPLRSTSMTGGPA